MIYFFLKLLKNHDFYTLKQCFKKMYREAREQSLKVKFYSLLSAVALTHADHKFLHQLSHRLITKKQTLGFYILAQSHFLLGDYSAGLEFIDKYLKKNPHHPDASYLKSNILKELGEIELAWQVLEDISKKSGRLKTWMIMANLVNTVDDYNRLIRNHAFAQSVQKAPTFNINVNESLALGALRCKNYIAAYEIWEKTLSCKQLSQHVRKNRKKPSSFSTKNAEIALKDFNFLLKTKNIDMFLVSGTLLGCIREGKLLGHDKDVDVGVWDNTPNEELLDLIKTSGCFYLQASRAKEIVRIKHVNGIAIDVFYHYKDSNSLWHGGVKVKWHNSPFNLIKHHFLGYEYLIPENYDQYLTENYGDWRQPKYDFDSAFDTPNAEVINKHEMCIHAYKMLVKKPNLYNIDRYKNYLSNNKPLSFSSH